MNRSNDKVDRRAAPLRRPRGSEHLTPAQRDLAARHGFALESICWGYRDIFAGAIADLCAAGWIGDDQPALTAQFFAVLRRAERPDLDHVVCKFLECLHGPGRWLLQLPAILCDVTEVGMDLAWRRGAHGRRFFEVLARGGLGATPAEVRACLTTARRLAAIDDGLALTFVEGYRTLAGRLRPDEIETFVNEAARLHARSPEQAAAFLRGESRAADTYMMLLTQECRLPDVAGSLEALLHALTGRRVEVADLGALDSDDLIARGTKMLCLHDHLYLPVRMRHFRSAAQNRNWYRLVTILAAGMLVDDSFAAVHGHSRYPDCRVLVGIDPLRCNLFHIIEYARIVRRVQCRWPGARRLIDFGLRSMFKAAGPLTAPYRLFRDVMNAGVATDAVRRIRHAADESVNCLDTASLLDADSWGVVRDAYPQLGAALLEPMPLLSDFGFPVTYSNPPSESRVVDLARAAQRRRLDGSDAARREPESDFGSDIPEDKQAEPGETVDVCYLYDEWNFRENDYRRDYCRVRVTAAPAEPSVRIPDDLDDHSRKVRAAFERLRPDLARRQKYLPDGDAINVDQLTDYLIARRREPSPRVRFYEKHLLSRRDLAVQILLDVSGSTAGQDEGHARTIDLEKQAALVLAHGLAALDDRFAICGFTSSGRERCDYIVYKDFEEPWCEQTGARVASARPRNSTRIGPALRHSGWRLAQQPCRQRLILLVTDGKPMDSDYDPTSRYAQHDVRMACEENARRDIHTFAITTEANSRADMEIMFPRRRFALLEKIADLPRVMPNLYLRITT